MPWVAGSGLQRVYSPQPYQTEALTFRTHGPHNRFDHHRRSADGKARVDIERGILYAGDGLACCLGEFFADSTEITVPGTQVATISPTTDLTLLDLRKTAALGASTTQAIAAISERKTSQAWSRWWYEHPQLADIHGLPTPLPTPATRPSRCTNARSANSSCRSPSSSATQVWTLSSSSQRLSYAGLWRARRRRRYQRQLAAGRYLVVNPIIRPGSDREGEGDRTAFLITLTVAMNDDRGRLTTHSSIQIAESCTLRGAHYLGSRGSPVRGEVSSSTRSRRSI